MRVVSSFTADTADPLEALEPLVPCFLPNGAGNLTVLFSRCGNAANRTIAATGTMFLAHLLVV